MKAYQRSKITRRRRKAESATALDTESPLPAVIGILDGGNAGAVTGEAIGEVTRDEGTVAEVNEATAEIIACESEAV